MKGSNIRSVVLAPLVMLAAACGVDVRFEHVAGHTASNLVSPDLISLELGTATAVRLLDGDEELDEGTQIDIQTGEDSILGVDPTWDFDTFVFYGISPGQTDVIVTIDGELAAVIPATVASPE